MSDSKSDSEARVDAAIAEFLQAIETDPATSMLEFLHRHADIADELREFFADHAAMQGVAAGMTGSFSRLRSSRLSNSEKLPRQFGEFELLSVIGRGGLRTVHAARRDSVDSMCAIKVLHPWLLLEPTSRHRFAREAETTLRLQHPNIVPTLGSGCVDDVPYLEMKLIDGQSLDQRLKTRCKISDTVTMESTGTTALA